MCKRAWYHLGRQDVGGEFAKDVSGRVVVADAVPGVHAWVDGVVGSASLDGTSNGGGCEPDHLGEVQEVTDRFRWAGLTVQGCVDGFLIIPFLDSGGKSSFGGISTRVGVSGNSDVLSVSTTTSGPNSC